MTRVYTLSGLPGAGKTKAAELLGQLTGGRALETGRIVREMAADAGIEEPESHELAEFAAAKRREEGESFAVDRLIEMIDNDEFAFEEPLILDGIRHVAELHALRDHFEHVHAIWITVPFGERFERVSGRGREGEDEFTKRDMAIRDQRELKELGARTLVTSEELDHQVINDEDIPHLVGQLQSIAHATMRNHATPSDQQR